jgi:hypothetical protein
VDGRVEVVTGPRVPVLITIACAAGVVLVANLTSAPTAWIAARRRTADVLRTE